MMLTGYFTFYPLLATTGIFPGGNAPGIPVVPNIAIRINRLGVNRQRPN